MRQKYFVPLGILMVMALIVAGWEWRSPDSFIKQLELPEVARNLPTDPSQANLEFNKRVQAKYPTGIMESDLISRLSKDGFDIYPKAREANSVSQGLPCAYDHWLLWTVTKNNVVATIKGEWDYFCV
jgi:hypothetical protein